MNSSSRFVVPILRPFFVAPIRWYFRHVGFGRDAVWRIAAHTEWLQRNPEIVRTAFGSELCVNARDIVGRYIALFGIWEPDLTALIRQTLKPGDCFVDVGANVGYFTTLASLLVGDAGMVVAVEAVPGTASVLGENIARNAANNVRIVRAAAWHEKDVIDIHCGREMTGTATASAEWASHWGLGDIVTVEAAPLSTILTDDEIQHARIIKIDVEGAELEALRGLLPALQNCRDDLLILAEVAPHLSDWQEIRESLSILGFDVRAIRNDYLARSYYRSAGDEPALTDIPTAFDGIDQFDAVFARPEAMAAIHS